MKPLATWSLCWTLGLPNRPQGKAVSLPVHVPSACQAQGAAQVKEGRTMCGPLISTETRR
jgi:hypothetical protein